MAKVERASADVEETTLEVATETATVSVEEFAALSALVEKLRVHVNYLDSAVFGASAQPIAA